MRKLKGNPVLHLEQRLFPDTGQELPQFKHAFKWRALAGKNAIRIRLGYGSSVEQEFENVCEPAIRMAVDLGQTSLQVRLVLHEGDVGPPSHSVLTDLRRLLRDYGYGLEMGSLLTESRPSTSLSPIEYLPLTISW